MAKWRDEGWWEGGGAGLREVKHETVRWEVLEGCPWEGTLGTCGHSSPLPE